MEELVAELGSTFLGVASVFDELLQSDAVIAGFAANMCYYHRRKCGEYDIYP